MAFLRSIASSTTAIAASAIPAAAIAVSYLSSSSSSSSSPSQKSSRFSFLPPRILNLNRLGLVRSLTRPPSALHMEAPTSEANSSQKGAESPELLTEYMVDMKCEGCVNSVKNKLQTVDGVKSVEVDLDNQVVRIQGSTPVKNMTEALEQTGRKARLIGQGVPDEFLVSAAVAEFKGPKIFGVVRLAQINMELVRIEANFNGLSPGKHGWSINEFGDLTRGAVSTGNLFDSTAGQPADEPVGDLRTLDVDENGDCFFSGTKQKLRISDLIGRSIAVYETEDRSDPGIAAAVIARSAGVGENYKKVCSCDGTTIWEATNSDFVTKQGLTFRTNRKDPESFFRVFFVVEWDLRGQILFWF